MCGLYRLAHPAMHRVPVIQSRSLISLRTVGGAGLHTGYDALRYGFGHSLHELGALSYCEVCLFCEIMTSSQF